MAVDRVEILLRRPLAGPLDGVLGARVVIGKCRVSIHRAGSPLFESRGFLRKHARRTIFQAFRCSEILLGGWPSAPTQRLSYPAADSAGWVLLGRLSLASEVLVVSPTARASCRASISETQRLPTFFSRQNEARLCQLRSMPRPPAISRRG